MANSDQTIATPWEFYKALTRYTGIWPLYDMAADEFNTKTVQYFDETDNSLSIDWPINGWCFLNPPFKNLTQWVKKCQEQINRGVRIMTIWPLSGDINQIPTFENCRVIVVHGRVWPEVRGIMVSIWDKNIKPSIEGARWDKKEITKVWG